MSYEGESLLNTSPASVISRTSPMVFAFEDKHRESSQRERGCEAEQVIALEMGRRPAWPLRQVVDGSIIFQQKKGIQRAVFPGCLCTVKVSVILPPRMQFFHAIFGVLAELAQFAELDRL